MTLPERADYSLTESAFSPFPAEPAQYLKGGREKLLWMGFRDDRDLVMVPAGI